MMNNFIPVVFMVTVLTIFFGVMIAWLISLKKKENKEREEKKKKVQQYMQNQRTSSSNFSGNASGGAYSNNLHTNSGNDTAFMAAMLMNSSMGSHHPSNMHVDDGDSIVKSFNDVKPIPQQEESWSGIETRNSRESWSGIADTPNTSGGESWSGVSSSSSSTVSSCSSSSCSSSSCSSSSCGGGGD